MNKTVLAVGLLLTVPLLVVFALSFRSEPLTPASPLVGREAPPIELPALEGERVSLASLRGKPTLVHFWATWCAPCLAEHEVLQEAAKLLGDRVGFIGVVVDDEKDRVKAFLERHGARYPTLIDEEGRAAIAYGVQGIPEAFFIDAAGRIRSKHDGPLDLVLLVGYLQPLLEQR